MRSGHITLGQNPQQLEDSAKIPFFLTVLLLLLLLFFKNIKNYLSDTAF